eukprot:TRINITY_DN73095_c0_g1_i1.p1 TRINITY_DN73095_c0_g1~~TRINITY_DN73095_c0_g1_i1.p1  ORF type:complete len:516 (+),score=46.81 TRINITY_DN73095_c0_g1_i1:106-1653(+)
MLRRVTSNGSPCASAPPNSLETNRFGMANSEATRQTLQSRPRASFEHRAANVVQRVRRLERATEQLAFRIVHWKPLQHWFCVGIVVLLMAWFERMGFAEAPKHLCNVVMQLMSAMFGSLLDILVRSGLRMLLGSVASFLTIELVWGHLLGNVDFVHFPGRLAHPCPDGSLSTSSFYCLTFLIAVMCYFIFVPPDTWSLCFALWRAVCLIGSGLLLCASIFEQSGWVYIPCSALCLYFSGSTSCQFLLLLDGLAALGHSVAYFRHLYYLHEVKRDFHLRVRQIMNAELFHPVFVDESFERLVHTHIRTRFGRRLVFAAKRCLSFGTHVRLLRESLLGLKQSLEAFHGGSATNSTHTFKIKREHLLESSLAAVKSAPLSDLTSKHLLVAFDGEMGVDEGGLLRDWFDSVGSSLYEEAVQQSSAGISQPRCDKDKDSSTASSACKLAGMLMLQTCDQTLVLRPGTERWDDYYALGRFLALSILCGAHMPLHFSRASWKLLVDSPLEAADVFALDPPFF